ncbi:hypothetical protein DFH09DRAFT_1089441 [Mycena vulgaris]|nr:hypothetical protein DFH09DRAFT_1089441 [Mycena vulgaris]
MSLVFFSLETKSKERRLRGLNPELLWRDCSQPKLGAATSRYQTKPLSGSLKLLRKIFQPPPQAVRSQRGACGGANSFSPLGSSYAGRTRPRCVTRCVRSRSAAGDCRESKRAEEQREDRGGEDRVVGFYLSPLRRGAVYRGISVFKTHAINPSRVQRRLRSRPSSTSLSGDGVIWARPGEAVLGAGERYMRCIEDNEEEDVMSHCGITTPVCGPWAVAFNAGAGPEIRPRGRHRREVSYDGDVGGCLPALHGRARTDVEVKIPAQPPAEGIIIDVGVGRFRSGPGWRSNKAADAARVLARWPGIPAHLFPGSGAMPDIRRACADVPAVSR